MLEEFEGGEEEVVGEGEVVDAEGVGSVAVEAVGDVEVHFFVSDALALSVDGVVCIPNQVLSDPRSSHMLRCS